MEVGWDGMASPMTRCLRMTIRLKFAAFTLYNTRIPSLFCGNCIFVLSYFHVEVDVKLDIVEAKATGRS